jgi:hypothetical protein
LQFSVHCLFRFFAVGTKKRDPAVELNRAPPKPPKRVGVRHAIRSYRKSRATAFLKRLLGFTLMPGSGMSRISESRLQLRRNLLYIRPQNLPGYRAKFIFLAIQFSQELETAASREDGISTVLARMRSWDFGVSRFFREMFENQTNGIWRKNVPFSLFRETQSRQTRRSQGKFGLQESRDYGQKVA